MAISEITSAFHLLKINEIRDIVLRSIESGEDAGTILKVCQQAMEDIGAKFETGEYYLGELMMSAKMFERATEVLNPLLSKSTTESKNTFCTILLGTPKGDIHDLGKNIFKIMASAAGFTVIDLGVDVSAEKFVEKVREKAPEIVGMSALLTTTYPSMKEVVDLLILNDLRAKVKIIIGGGATGVEAQRYVGADAQTLDANEGVRICKAFVK